jgi:hypothetical protein
VAQGVGPELHPQKKKKVRGRGRRVTEGFTERKGGWRRKESFNRSRKRGWWVRVGGMFVQVHRGV